jgi:spore germination protein GerM
MKLHSYKSLQDEVFWQSAILFIAAGIAFGWMGAIFSSIPKSLEVAQQDVIQKVPLNPPVAPSIAPTTAAQPRIPVVTLSEAQVYWLAVKDNQVQMKPQTLSFMPNASREQRLKTALEVLLKPASQTTNSSAIPTGTRLLNLQVKAGEVHINLSREFGQGGGSSSLIYRVAQLLYTATCLEPDSRVYLSIEGQPLDETHPLGGEGLLLPAPLTRQTFAAEFNLS